MSTEYRSDKPKNGNIMLTIRRKQIQRTNVRNTEAKHVKNRVSKLALFSALALLLSVSISYSQITSTFASVFTQNQKGAIVMVGNTLMTCSASSTCTTAQGGGSYNNNDFSMVNIDIDGISGTWNSSSADFTLGSSQTVLYAGLFWSGVSGSSQRNKVQFSTPASGGYVTITGSISSTTYGYQGYADVTSYVQAGGSGTYMTGGVRNTTGNNQWAGWVIVVVIQDPTMMLRNLTVFKGLGLVNSSNTSLNIPISGFKTPLSGTVNTQLGIVVWDGDRVYTGDSLKLNSTGISNTLNPLDNFFNSSITQLNANITDRNPNYINTMGLDADIVDASNIIPNGATTATIHLTTGGESYMPGVVTNAIQLFAPDIQTTKIARDLTPGFYEPTDTVEYTLTSKNIGNDGATSLILLDTLTSIGTFVPGSLSIVSGANAGTKTDASGDDQAEYNSLSKAITFRLGTGANSSSGGSLAVNDSTKVRFKMVVSAAAADRSLIHNQGTLSFTSATLVQPFVVKTFSSDTVVVWASDLKVTKVASASTIQAGNNVTYTVKVKNYGKKDATSVALADTIPAGITYISNTATKGSYNNFSGAWSIG